MIAYIYMKFFDTLNREPSLFLFRKFWAFTAHKRLVILYTCMFLIANLVILLQPPVFGSFMREIQLNGIGGGNLNTLLLLLSYLFLIEFFFWIIYAPARVIENYVGFHAKIAYSKFLLKGVLDLGLQWHGEHDSGNTIDKVSKATSGLGDFSSNIFQIIQLVVRLVGTTTVLIWFSPQIAMWVLFVILLSFVIVFWFDKYLVAQFRELNEYANKVMAGIFDALSNVTSVKILHIEKPILDGIVRRMSESEQLFNQNSKLNEAKWFTGGIIFQGIAIVPLMAYLYFGVQNGKEIDIGTVSTLYLYLANLIYIYFGFTSFYESLLRYKNQILNVQPVEDAFLGIAQSHMIGVRPWGTMSIQDLNFTYVEESDVMHLDRLKIEIQKGERIAVIGESGSGKTTFLKVLHGLYTNASGQVAFDGGTTISTSFADLDLKTMLVPQEPEIFSSTIRENITLGTPCTESDIEKVIRLAQFDAAIAELPKGLDSVINEKGVNLSGGQKQRLALARALLFSQGKEIILLDESTSSVDMENEMKIYQNIWKEFTGVTIIASIHKMNLLKLFDHIFMFEKGTIAGHGTFDELLQKNKSFKAAWKEFIKTEQGSEKKK